jgi:signal transduction histidine kinase
MTASASIAGPGPVNRSESVATGAHAWQLTAAAAAIPLTTTAVGWALTGDHVTRPAATAAYRGFLVAGFLIAGVVWLQRRPANRIGRLLVIFAAAWWLVSLQGSDDALLFTLGIVGQVPVFVLTFYLCLAFPHGRLRSGIERAVLASAVIAGTILVVPTLLFARSVPGSGVLAGCRPTCPRNAFLVASRPAVADAFTALRTVLILVVIAAVLAMLVVRWVTASRPRRRLLSPVLLCSMLLLPAFTGFEVARRVLDLDPAAVEAIGWPLVAARVAFPLSFLAALASTELYAAAALRGLVAGLATPPSLATWRFAVASALDDRSLRIGYAQNGTFRESDGGVLQQPTRPGRLLVVVQRDGRPLAAIETDAALADEPELIGAVCEATLAAIHSGRLDGELQALRGRVVDAGDAERRRLVRDLHDGLQQRLTVLRVHLSLAEDRPRATVAEEREALRRLGAQVQEAIDELRAVVRGLSPPLLSYHGPAAALRSLTVASGLPVQVENHVARRHDERVETCAYFCCLEAIQNAVRHAGPAAEIRVHLSDDDELFTFVVEDNGTGFDSAWVTHGLGLTNLNDRVAALGGTIDIDANPGTGVRVTGHIPSRTANDAPSRSADTR